MKPSQKTVINMYTQAKAAERTYIILTHLKSLGCDEHVRRLVHKLTRPHAGYL